MLRAMSLEKNFARKKQDADLFHNRLDGAIVSEVNISANILMWLGKHSNTYNLGTFTSPPSSCP